MGVFSIHSSFQLWTCVLCFSLRTEGLSLILPHPQSYLHFLSLGLWAFQLCLQRVATHLSGFLCPYAHIRVGGNDSRCALCWYCILQCLLALPKLSLCEVRSWIVSLLFVTMWWRTCGWVWLLLHMYPPWILIFLLAHTHLAFSKLINMLPK